MLTFAILALVRHIAGANANRHILQIIATASALRQQHNSSRSVVGAVARHYGLQAVAVAAQPELVLALHRPMARLVHAPIHNAMLCGEKLK